MVFYKIRDIKNTVSALKLAEIDIYPM